VNVAKKGKSRVRGKAGENRTGTGSWNKKPGNSVKRDTGGSAKKNDVRLRDAKPKYT